MSFPLKTSKVVAAFVIGGLVGGAIVYLVLPRRSDGDRYTLLKDLDLSAMYFYAPEKTAPVKGIIQQGSEFEVEWRYSDADYVVFRTVIDRQKLMRLAKPVQTSAGEPRVNTGPKGSPRPLVRHRIVSP